MARTLRRHTNPVLLAFGDRLRELRYKAKLTQEKLAFEAGLERSYVGQCERGERNLSLQNVVKLARAMNVRPAELLANIDARS
jgi:transcriptional regulator with XRE-family HTH domain